MYIAVHQYPVEVKTNETANFTGRAGIYIWNRVSVQLSSADFIELPGVREIKKIYASPDGQLKLLTINESGISELRQFGYNDSGGVVFPVVKELGLGAVPQFPDGLTLAGNKAVWLANNGSVFCEKGNAVTKLFEIKAQGNTTSGVLSNITASTILFGSDSESSDNGFRNNKQALTFSYKDGSNFLVRKIYPFDLKTGANGNQTPNQGDVYTGITYIPIKSIVRQIRIYNAPTQSATDTVIATVKIYFNQSSTPGITKSISLKEAKRGYVDFSINQPYIQAIQFEIEWATGTPIGDDMYMPSVAVISTDEVPAKSPDNG
jgi:hypothetical protein